MWTHDNRPPSANVVAEFDSQDDADEAILGLRLAGFRDHQMGYYSPNPAGVMEDLLERNHWIAGATLGTMAGAAIGVWLARVIPGWESEYTRGLDPLGLLISCVTFGALFLGTVGGLIGLAVPRREVAAPVPTGGPLVLAVSAGDARDLAREVLRQHGGREVVVERPADRPGRVAAHPA